jgi:hypothetical protein
MQVDQTTLLAVLVSDSELTQDEIVEGFVRCAREHSEDAALSLRTLRRWMVGDVQTQPRPAQRRVARRYWGFAMHELLASPTRETTVPQASELAIVPDRVDAALSIKALERQITMSARRAARFTTYAETHNIGTEAIEQLRHDVVGLANAYMREPLTTIMGDLIELQDIAFGFLEGKQKPAQTRDLYVLASVVTGMVAKASQDLGRFHDAMTLARTMYVCADNADHLGLRAWARGLQSLIANWAGRPQEALRLAETGSAIAADHTGSVTVWLAAQAAVAAAQCAGGNETQSAIARAARCRDSVQPDDLDLIGGLFTFSLAKQHYYAAEAYVLLGDADEAAEREALEAFELYEHGPPEDRSFRAEAGVKADLALARIHLGQLDGAQEALAPVRPERRTDGIVISMGRVRRALLEQRCIDSHAARELRDEIEAFCRVPAAALSA